MFIQAQWSWNYEIIDSEVEKVKGYPSYGSCKDSLHCNMILNNLVKSLRENGYVTANIDNRTVDSNSVSASLFLGESLEFVQINNTLALRENAWVGSPGSNWSESPGITFNRYRKIRRKLLTNMEVEGYPFASVGLQISSIQGNSVSGNLEIDPGQRITIDSLRVKGNSLVKQSFIEGVLGLKSGTPYNEKKMRDIPRVLGNLDYLELVSGPEVLFQSNDQVLVDLLVQGRKASSFDVLLGFLPNGGRDGGFLFTGLVTLDLMNPFGTGKRFFLQWSRLEQQTQRLDAAVSLPYLFKTPLGLDFGLDLYKFDSLYLDLNWMAGLSFQFTGNSSLTGFIKNESTFVLGVDSTFFKGPGEFPIIQDIRVNNFGLRYTYSSLDFRPAPREGLDLMLEASSGFRNIKRNDEIEALANPNTGETYGEIYDRSDLKSTRLNLGLSLGYFQPVGKRQTIFLSLRSKVLISKNLFFNEKYRIGGNRLLRGFNEESIFTPYYGVFSAEYRFFLDKSSYLFGFFDQGVIESQANPSKTDFPFGFGLGLSLETKAGWFSLSYALGRQEANPIDFRTAKIHFGYVNRF